MFHHIFQSSPIAITLTNLSDGSYVAVNPAAERLLGYDRDELVGQQQGEWERSLTPGSRDELLRVLGEQGRVEGFPCTLTTRTGASRDCLLSIESLEIDEKTYALTHIVDISAYTRVNQARDEAQERYRQDLTAPNEADAALRQATLHLQILADTSAAFAKAGMDEHVLLGTLTRCAADALRAGCVIRLCRDDEPWLDVAIVYNSDPALQELGQRLLERAPIHTDSPYLTAQVVRDGQARLIPEIDPEALRAALEPELWPILDVAPVQSMLITPLRSHNRILGCLEFIRHTPGQPAFTQDDLTLAQDLSDRAGLALINARLYRDVQVAQRTAQQAHARLEALIASLPTGVGYLDRELHYQLVNPALAAINGLSPDEHLGQPLTAIVPGMALTIEPLLHQVLASGKPVSNTELQGRSRSDPDTIQTWLVSYFPVPEPEHAIAGVGVMVTNITTIRRTEAALQASMTRLHAALDSMTDAIFITDAEGQLIEFNEAFATYHRFTSKQECPKSLDIFPALFEVTRLTGELVPIKQWAVSRALTGEIATNVEYILRRKDTGETWMGSYSFAPVRDRDGAITGAVVISRDITSSKQAELRLRQSEARFATIFEHSPIALGISRLSDGQITDVNAAFLDLYGYTYEEVIGRTTLELGLWVHPEDRQYVLDQIYSQQQITSFEAGAHTVAGEDRQVLLSGELVQIHDEPHVLMQIMDITALNVAQQELRELNRTLEERVQQRTAEVQDLYDRAPTGYYSLDAEGCIIRVNQTLLNWLGYAREEVLGHSFNDLVLPAFHARFAAGFAAFKERGWLRDVDGVFIRKDGSNFYGLLNATAVYDANGLYLSSRASVLDNTERREAEEALRESEAQNRLLFEESPEAVALVHRQGRIVRANRAFAQLVGHPVERLQDQMLDTLGLLSPSQLAQLAADVRPVLKQESGFAEAIIRITRSDGNLRTVEMRAFALTIHGERHYLASFHDITRERLTEEVLRQANAELARAARSKDEFLANMSHELRTPINAILAYSESLQDAIYGPLTPRQHNAIDAVATAGRHLLTLINDILDLAKVEAGRIELQIRRVSVQEIGQSSLLFVREQALKKRLRLSFQLTDQEATLDVDPTRLKQMLVNLLSNAVKFTPDGGSVGLEVTLDQEDGVIQFVVHDTGIGIAPEDLGRLFQPFSQVDASLNREHDGAGLGLALVRRLAEMHGGSVTVESEVGKGSRFTIALAYRAAPDEGAIGGEEPYADLAKGEPALAARPLRGRILLAEDNETNSDVLCDYLDARGYIVVVARDGHEALALVEDFQPQLILMDIQMPYMNGLEAIRHLRAQPPYAAIPIIALTALAMPGDEERCLAAGATLYLTKPVSLKGLVETIQHLLEQSC